MTISPLPSAVADLSRTTDPAAPAARRRPTRGVRWAAGLAALTIGAALLAGCGSEGASTDCGLDACTVTFARGVEARASFLGIEAKLIGTEGDRVTVEVAGEQVTLTVGEQATEVGGFAVSLERLTESQAAIRVARQ